MSPSFWRRLFGSEGPEQIDWLAWVDDPVTRATGVTFDRTPAGKIVAPESKIRVCAYHIDHDERPTCYVDVDTIEEAAQICARLSDLRGDFSVDYAVGYDDQGARVTEPSW